MFRWLWRCVKSLDNRVPTQYHLAVGKALHWNTCKRTFLMLILVAKDKKVAIPKLSNYKLACSILAPGKSLDTLIFQTSCIIFNCLSSAKTTHKSHCSSGIYLTKPKLCLPLVLSRTCGCVTEVRKNVRDTQSKGEILKVGWFHTNNFSYLREVGTQSKWRVKWSSDR